MKILLFWALALALVVQEVTANVKGVIAHFMQSNSLSYTIADWETDFNLAKEAHIDAFVLNIAVNETTNGASLSNAFVAANNRDFKLFLSFDYAGNGLWPKADVIAMIQRFQTNAAYYKRGSQALVSTFEGPAASADWTDIKAQTGCFFIPSWSSLGAAPALARGTPDGLFSWAAWPTGPNPMNTFTDSSYLDTLGAKPYMMGVSPWFYGNMPGFRKNWLWKSDSLWFDRWINIMFIQPEYVQIITWNDYGECHHIGPLRPSPSDTAYEAFARGRAPSNYALDKNHDGWRRFLPYLIDLTKTNRTTISQEMVTAWYRQNPGGACGTGGTTGNTASQLQQVFSPAELMEDKIFYAAILGSTATVSVSVGGTAIPATWTYTPSGNIGLYRGSVAYGGARGNVVVMINRGGAVASITGKPISSSCTNGLSNWNANVEFSLGPAIAAASPVSLDQSGCTSGFGDARYGRLCELACSLDYCPRGSCTCTSIGTRKTRPVAKNLFACPAEGKDKTFLGLCSFVCNYFTCPDVCKIAPTGTICDAPFPTVPPVPKCIEGMADGPYANLCSLACFHGFCPPEICSCTTAGTTLPADLPTTGVIGTPKGAYDYGLCAWACMRSECPPGLCNSAAGSPPKPPGAKFFQLGLMTAQQVTNNIQGQLGNACFRSFECAWQSDDLDDSELFITDRMKAICPDGQKKIGWDQAGCDKGKGKTICCEHSTSFEPETCLWRGDGVDCNGQCHTGEVTVIKSSWGGQPTLGNQKQCNRGVKTLCCQAPDFEQLQSGCSWTGCWRSCNKDTEVEVTTRARLCLNTEYESFCCPTPTTLYDCTWRGKASDCADAKCLPDEVQLTENSWGGGTKGDDNGMCHWGRRKVDCCKARAPEPPELAGDCKWDFCANNPLLCEEIDAGLSTRDLSPNSIIPEDRAMSMIENRANSKPVQVQVGNLQYTLKTLPWPQVKHGIVASGGMTYLAIAATGCAQVTLLKGIASQVSQLPSEIVSWTVDHVLEIATVKSLLSTFETGRLPGGGESAYGQVSLLILNTLLSVDTLVTPEGKRVITFPSGITQPVKTLFAALGHGSNLFPFTVMEKELNSMKGAWFSQVYPIWQKGGVSGPELWQNMIIAGLQDEALIAGWDSVLRNAFGVFEIYKSAEMWARFMVVRGKFGEALKFLETNMGLDWQLEWRFYEWFDAKMILMQSFARETLAQMIQEAFRIINEDQIADMAFKAAQRALLISWKRRLGDIYLPTFGGPGIE